uniref:F-box domain-containing protein n=1 Tax=Aegilops tauschii TaxID=37682 RepID=R7W0Y6_AEGTA
MAGGGVDRLSSLSNDLLHRILHFAPLKQAASTTALSRRFPAPLWLSSGAVNLETGVVIIEKNKYRRRHGHDHDNAHARFFSGSDDLVSAATGALAAAAVPVTRLTLITWYPDRDEIASRYNDLVEVVLSHPAVRRVEELLLTAKDPKGNPYDRVVNCIVTLDSLALQLKTLWILELTNCSGLVYHGEAVLPRLSSLRLSHCSQQLGSLQRIIDAAPALAAVRLESVFITQEEEAIEFKRRRLRCPATTVLVLDSCRWEVKIQAPGYCWNLPKTIDRLEIVAMRLRRFSYKGPLLTYSFSRQPLELEQVDLEFFEQGYSVKDPNRDLGQLHRATSNGPPV